MIVLIESTTTTTAASSSSSTVHDHGPLSLPSSTFPNAMSSNTSHNPSSQSSMGNSDDDLTTTPCARAVAAREYAYVDCSEVYLAGKRTNGIYEIW